MNKSRWISALVLPAALALPAAAAPGRAVITADEVAAAITGAGIPTAPAQVAMLSNVVAASPEPRLKVESMQKFGDQRMSVRVGCETAGECLPFYVAVRLDAALAQQAAPAPTAGMSRAAAGYVTNPGPISVRSGSPVILLLEGPHVQIMTTVVCLEGGSPGQTIRVSSQDHHLTYTAQVVDSTHVRGRL